MSISRDQLKVKMQESIVFILCSETTENRQFKIQNLFGLLVRREGAMG